MLYYVGIRDPIVKHASHIQTAFLYYALQTLPIPSLPFVHILIIIIIIIAETSQYICEKSYLNHSNNFVNIKGKPGKV